jgi:hypothetical protein
MSSLGSRGASLDRTSTRLKGVTSRVSCDLVRVRFGETRDYEDAGGVEAVRGLMNDASRPEVHYARSGDVSIAYQTVGEGPSDLVYVPFLANIIWQWEQPLYVRMYGRLSSFARLILLDKRGTGLSDRPRDLPTLETRMDDIRAVMDAAGSERAALIGTSAGDNFARSLRPRIPSERRR